MKILYIDCGMGAAGDMLTAALLELLPDPDQFVRKLNALGLPGVEFKKEPVRKRKAATTRATGLCTCTNTDMIPTKRNTGITTSTAIITADCMTSSISSGDTCLFPKR